MCEMKVFTARSPRSPPFVNGDDALPLRCELRQAAWVQCGRCITSHARV